MGKAKDIEIPAARFPRRALDEQAAADLWRVAEQLRRVTYPTA